MAQLCWRSPIDDTAARRAAEIVLRADVAVKVASVEDLKIVLDQRLGKATTSS